MDAARPHRIFDRNAYRLRRVRNAFPDSDQFLLTESAEQIAARVAAINRRFSSALDLSSRKRSFEILRESASRWTRTGFSEDSDIVADEETLPVTDASFDLITSVLSLHAVNDLPGTLVQIRRALKPDGVFIASLFGGDSLRELKLSFAAAEAGLLGGASPRVAPFADVRDLGGLLQRAGFALPVADAERTIVHYREPMRLFVDLRAIGETNVLAQRRPNFVSRRLLAEAVAEYRRQFGDDLGRVPAIFDIIYLIGWAPHESQQKPLRPGSGRVRLADVLKPRGESGT
jgi:SAM-dependent methyltransferase